MATFMNQPEHIRIRPSRVAFATTMTFTILFIKRRRSCYRRSFHLPRKEIRMRFQFEPAPPPGKLTREQTKAAYERHALAHGAHDGKGWETMGHIFAPNATYHDTFYGWLH